MGHWGTCPPRLPTISLLVHFRVNLTTNYPRLRAVCESSLRRCQQLTAHTYCINHKIISHRAAAAPGPEVRRECPMTYFAALPSSQQILATPLSEPSVRLYKKYKQIWVPPGGLIPNIQILQPM